jgi:hypothetical protein
MTTARHLLFAALPGVAATLLVSTLARAETLDERDKSAFGSAYSLLDASLMTASGTRRGGGSDVGYDRKGGAVEYRVGGFFDENYFKTLIGLEGLVGLGYQGENDFEPPKAPAPTPSQPGAPSVAPVAPAQPYNDIDKGAYYVHVEAAFTYGLVRWRRGIPGRVVLGVGGGFELAPRFRGSEGGEGYATLFGRLQLWPTETVGLHLTATTNVGSYRFEGLATIGTFALGGRLRLLNATRDDRTQETQLEAVAGILF